MLLTSENGADVATNAAVLGGSATADPGQKQRRAGRLPGLDGLRALAVSLVVSGHVNSTAAHPSIYLARLTPKPIAGVNVFFVLSGFLITWLLLAEERANGQISLAGFYFRRAFRILPPAIVYLIVAYVGSRLFSQGLVVSNGDFLRSLFFVRNYFGGSKSTDHFWSLAIEEQFYLIWPLIFLILRGNWRIRFTMCVLILSPIWWAIRPQLLGASGETAYAFDTHCHFLVAGCLLALVRGTKEGHQWLSARWLHSSPAAVVGTLIVVSLSLPGAPMAFVAECILPILMALLVNYVIEDRRSAASYFLNSKPVVWIGRLSYSLYLWQQLFCLSTHHPDAWIRRPPQSIGLSLIAAACSFYFVERPFLRMRDRLSSRTVGMAGPP